MPKRLSRTIYGSAGTALAFPNCQSPITNHGPSMKKAVVLLSGGMDSAAVVAMAREQGFVVHALSVRYGQRHTSELEAAARVAQALGVAAQALQRQVGVSFTGSKRVPSLSVTW